MTLINGKVYGWSQVEISVNGQELTGITEVNYSEEVEMEDIYQLGNPNSYGRSYGKSILTGSIGMYADTMEAITKASPTGRVQDVVLTITVAYLDDNGDGVSHKLEKVQIPKNERGVSIGDKSIIVKSDLLIGGINWKV